VTGRAELRRLQGTGLSDAANAKARKAFGLPADAPVTTPGR